MAEENKNTSNASEQAAAAAETTQETKGAEQTTTAKKYTDDEVNGIVARREKKAVEKFLKDMGITDRAQAEQVLKETAKQNAGNQTDADYQRQIEALQTELAAAKLDAAVGLAIRDAKGTDADYLAFKLKAMGDLELDDDGRIKDIDKKIGALKTQYPAMFVAETAGGAKQVDPQKLETGSGADTGVTKQSLMKMSYADRAAYQSEHPDEYAKIMKE